MELFLFNKELAQHCTIGIDSLKVIYGEPAIQHPKLQVKYMRVRDVSKDVVKNALKGKCDCLTPDKVEYGVIEYNGKLIAAVGKVKDNKWKFIINLKTA